MEQTEIRVAAVQAVAGRLPVAALATALQLPDTALVVLFVGHAIDRQGLAAELAAAFPGVPLIACTTAGEIGPHGYQTDSVTGVALPARHFSVELLRFDPLREVGAAEWSYRTRQGVRHLAERSIANGHENPFAFLMIDGLSMGEEALVRTLHAALGRIPLVGGSAGDGLRFERTQVLVDGEFRDDAAVLALVASDLPVKTFKTQHFERSEQRMVVTAADPAARLITEINGLPAAAEYARLVGVAEGALTPQVFAAHPVVVRVGETDYVRSIQQANSDGSLAFFCAIDVGIVLRIARGADLVRNLAQAFAEVEWEIGTPQLILGCDCILRYLEAEQKGLVGELSALLAAHRVIGFSSYGEQYRGMHVNQTFTGVAIGAAGRRAGQGTA